MKKTIFFLFFTSLIGQTAQEWHQKGVEYRKEEKLGKAIDCFKQAIKQKHKANYYFDLAYTYGMIGKTNDAIHIYKQMISLWPQTEKQLTYNIAYCAKLTEDLNLAIEYYMRALQLNPKNWQAHFGLALAYLAHGDYDKAWEHYAVHLQELNRNAPALRTLIENNNLYGKRILLRAEGGLGDTINFIRWGLWLKKFGAKVIASVQDPLLPLLANCYFIDELTSWKQKQPKHDAQVTLISANCVCHANEKTIPNVFPYILPDVSLDFFWKTQLEKDTNLKIGLCWQASVFNDSSRLPIARRGIPLEKLLSLCALPGITFYSLQKCDGVNEIDTINIPNNFVVFEKLDEAGAFMDSAAIINNLDLVISIDSAIAHLAGALGKPTWLLLPYQSDWRWLAHRTDSIWYPTMRIFKQTKPLDWDSVLLEVTKSLAART